MEAEKIVRSMINAIGDDPDRIGLKETPDSRTSSVQFMLPYTI